MDIVFIEALTIETVIGCLAWERRIKQKVVFDLEMFLDCSTTAKTDDLTYGIDYAAVCQRVMTFVEDSEFRLVETLAEQVAQIVLAEFPCERIKIRLRKPAAVPGTQSVGVIIERAK